MTTVLGTTLIESSLTTVDLVLIYFLCRLESGDGFTWAWMVCAANKRHRNRYILGCFKCFASGLVIQIYYLLCKTGKTTDLLLPVAESSHKRSNLPGNLSVL